MHGLWVNFIQELILLCTQVAILTGTFLLHKAFRSVNVQLQARLMQFDKQSGQSM